MFRRSRSCSDLSNQSDDGPTSRRGIPLSTESSTTYESPLNLTKEPNPSSEATSNRRSPTRNRNPPEPHPTSPAHSTQSTHSTHSNQSNHSTQSTHSSQSSTASTVQLEMPNYYQQIQNNHSLHNQQYTTSQTGYTTPLSAASSTSFSLQFQNNHRNTLNINGSMQKRHSRRGRGQPHHTYKPPLSPLNRNIMRMKAGCLAFLSFGAMYVVFLFVWTREVRMALNECIEFPENPLYTEISISNRDSTSPPYRLMHVYPQGSPNNINRPLTEKEIWNNGAPVLFVPGHGGSYNQIKASAAQALVEARSLHGGSKLNFFTVDTLEVPSGLAAELLWSQAHFINVCIERILQEYKNKHPAAPQVSSLLVLAHSMGGMAVRAAPLLPNFQIGSIGAIVTLNTPHLAHPFGGDGYLEEFYAKVNGFWMSGSSWRNSDATNAVPPLSNIVIASIAGGSRDHVVWGDLTSVG